MGTRRGEGHCARGCEGGTPAVLDREQRRRLTPIESQSPQEGDTRMGLQCAS